MRTKSTATPLLSQSRSDSGRMIVAISFNRDMGDGWEFANIPDDYPKKYSSIAIRLGLNYVAYAMTH